MEEILASIRRIISDDQAAKPGVPPTNSAPAAPAAASVAAASPIVAAPSPLTLIPPQPEEDDILDLSPKPPARTPEPHYVTDDPVANDLSFEAAAPPAPPPMQDDIDALMAAAEVEPPSAPEPPAPPALAPERLISSTTDRVVSSAFSNLANTVLSNNARTLDDVVQDMLRPMVKSWLDDNLPGIVERLVRAEIERVARGGR